MLESATKRLGIPKKNFFMTKGVKDFANTQNLKIGSSEYLHMIKLNYFKTLL